MTKYNNVFRAMLWLRQFVTSLLPQKPGLHPRLVHQELLHKGALVEIFFSKGKIMWLQYHKYASTIILMIRDISRGTLCNSTYIR
jgi:hypothetical protein